MNQNNNTNPTNPNNNNNGFGPQTNPFTGDLKGEFTSNFGTNTNTVSQIFKEGGFSSGNRTKYYILGALLLLLAGAAVYVFTADHGMDEMAPPTAVVPPPPKTEAAPPPAQAAPAPAAPVAEAPVAETAPAEAGATGPISLTSPSDGSSLNYDETRAAAQFSWQGGPGTIVFARSSSMKPEVLRVAVQGSSYSFANPWPGKWYWKVETAGGASEVRSFTVTAPARRNITLTSPAANGAIKGTGGEVTWSGDQSVAYYRIELTTGGEWANPQYRFSSSGSKLQLNGVPAGKYQVRLGAFSEVSGRWEYTAPVEVTVE